MEYHFISKSYQYWQGRFKCPHCGTLDISCPIYYTDNDGKLSVSNYARCVKCLKVIRRYGHNLNEYTYRQFLYTVLAGERHKPECLYYDHNLQYPYPALTRSRVFGR